MKKSELGKLVSEYKTLISRQEKKFDQKNQEKILEIRHRYYHETGSELTD